MRGLPDLLATTGLLAAGALLLALGLHQVRQRRPARIAGGLRGTGDFVLGAAVMAAAAYHLNQIITE